MKQPLGLLNQPAQQNKQQQKEQTMSNTSNIKQLRDIPRLFNCMFEHEVAKTVVKYDYVGPKISRETWNEVLAFFRWTYKDHNSESQVRMFVHPEHGWKAWAFPQKARTGMSAQELDEKDEGYNRTIEQRQQFKQEDGWLYFCTVHHHCNIGAFQSSTDEHNEMGQDGIHITIGNMGAAKYAIDARMYYCGYKLVSLNMSKYWDIGDALSSIPERLRRLLPDNTEHMLALEQMCEPPPENATFSEVWRANVIEPPKPTPPLPVKFEPSPQPWSYASANYSTYNNAANGNGHMSGTFRGKYRNGWKGAELYVSRCFPTYTADVESAILDIMEWQKLNQQNQHFADMKNVMAFFERIEPLDNDEIELLEIVLRNDCNLGAFLHGLTEHMLENEMLKEEEKELKEQQELEQEAKDLMMAEGSITPTSVEVAPANMTPAQMWEEHFKEAQSKLEAGKLPDEQTIGFGGYDSYGH